MRSNDLVHDIRQQLMVISGRAELLLSQCTDDKDRSSCQAIREAARAIERLLRQHGDQDLAADLPHVKSRKTATKKGLNKP